MGVSLINTHNEVKKLYRSLERILHFSGESSNIDFLISSLTEHNPFNSTDEIAQWLSDMNNVEYFYVKTLPLADLRKWYFDRWTGNLSHESGGFFSICGLKVQTNIGPVKKWTQPIIYQPEIGILGIVTKRIDGILYLLMQAKPEPGNINTFQLSPTVQATRSNYTQVHGGKPIPYLEYFLDKGDVQILVDQLQSEQGARFYRKRNRNIIVRMPDDEDIKLGPNFRWVTLGQLKQLMLLDNMVNMDTRSVVSNIEYDPDVKNSSDSIHIGDLRSALENSPLVTKPLSALGLKMIVSAHGNTYSFHTMRELLCQLSREKFKCELNARLIPLNEVRDWRRTLSEISHVDKKYFSVIGVRVEADNREVPTWDQPIVKQVDPGIVGFIIREFDSIVHFLVQLKMESGNMDLLEMAPTVQCVTGSYQSDHEPPFVCDMVNAKGDNVVFDTLQSEEGGRFYHEENRNMLWMVDESFPAEESSRYFWMSKKQINHFLRFNNFLNVESRSLLAII